MSNTILKIPQGNGNHITEVGLPFYYRIHGSQYYAFRPCSDGRHIRRIYVDKHAGDISFRDLYQVHYLDLDDMARVLMLEKNFVMIAEAEFIRALGETIDRVKL